MAAPQPHDKMFLFPQTATNPWIEEYARAELNGKNEATLDAYLRILRQLTWESRYFGYLLRRKNATRGLDGKGEPTPIW